MTGQEAIKQHISECNHRIEVIENFEQSNQGADMLRCEKNIRVLEVAIKALEEIQQYRAIGTVEECREALEKQRAKKPVKRSFVIPYEGIDVCPNCKEPISKKEHHCKCGQAIDWSDG